MKIPTSEIKKISDTGQKAPNSLFEILNKDISFQTKGSKSKIKQNYFQELSLLLSAGIDIKTAMELHLSKIKN